MSNSDLPASAGKPPTLLLASASRYRAELLGRLHLPFETQASAVDESPAPDESVAALVRRLARAKAGALAAAYPRHWILGSDQAASVGGEILGKPGSLENARRQLRRCSGQRVEFHTAVVLLRDDRCLDAHDVTTVRFRTLSDAAIERYLAAEPALDCAGSFRCEGYGISLFEAIDNCDPTALIGLPLIATCRLLRAAGYEIP